MNPKNRKVFVVGQEIGGVRLVTAPDKTAPPPALQWRYDVICLHCGAPGNLSRTGLLNRIAEDKTYCKQCRPQTNTKLEQAKKLTAKTVEVPGWGTLHPLGKMGSRFGP